MARPNSTSLFSAALVGPALIGALTKLDPRKMIKNPVMFVVEVVAALTTVLFVRDVAIGRGQPRLLRPDHPLALVHRPVCQLRRGHRRGTRQGPGRQPPAHPHRDHGQAPEPRRRPGAFETIPGNDLKVGDVVLVEAGDIIPSDGEVILGVASVNEAAITGESAPVIRESGGDRSAVTGGTQVLSDEIRVRITAAAGSTFVDRMIALVEGASRQKTPNEIALNILLAGLTIIFVFAVASDPELRLLCGRLDPAHRPRRALRHPDPDDDRGAPVRHRHRRHGPPCALQRPCHVGARRRGGWRRRYAAARQDRHDHARQPPQAPSSVPSAAYPSRTSPTPPSWPRWPTRRRRVAPSWCWPRRSTASAPATWRSLNATFVPFTAQTRMSGVDLDGSSIRKGAVDSIIASVEPAADGHTRIERGPGLQPRRRRRCRARDPGHRRGRRQGRRHAARRDAGRPASRRRLPQGHREGRHTRALRGAAPAWASAR